MLTLGLIWAVLPALATARQKDNRVCASDPFADPKTDPCNPLTYIASNVITGISFGLLVAVALIQTFSMRKWGAKWMLPMTIGAYTFAFGIGTRFGLHSMPDSKGIYIVMYLFVVLSPCAFIASDYILLGRLATDLNVGQYLSISPGRITKVFIASDVTTFLIQAAGGALSISSNDAKSALNGSHIFLAGLVLQLVSFLFFTCLYLIFLYRVRRHEPATWSRDSVLPWHQDWRTLAGILFISCIGILIRSVYRTIELSQGFKGRLATIEGFFYGLDTYPLFVAIAVYAIFWPGRFIPHADYTAPVQDGVEKIPVSGEGTKELPTAL